MMRKAIALLTLLATISLTAGQEAIKLEPPLKRESLGQYVGQRVQIEGMYYYGIYPAPAILVKGGVFFLIENPPGKGQYKFPDTPQKVTITGTLYHYDHSQFGREDYGRLGNAYYFFNVDESQIQFGEVEATDPTS